MALFQCVVVQKEIQKLEVNNTEDPAKLRKAFACNSAVRWKTIRFHISPVCEENVTWKQKCTKLIGCLGSSWLPPLFCERRKVFGALQEPRKLEGPESPFFQEAPPACFRLPDFVPLLQ